MSLVLDFSDALGNISKTIVHILTINMARVPIFFSIFKEIINTNRAKAQRIKIRNNPIPTPNIKLVMSLKARNS